MAKILIVLLVALVVEAMGVVLLSKGLKQIGPVERVGVAEVARVFRAGITHPSILLGVALEAAFFVALLYLLSQKDVTVIWPLTSLGFVITAFAAKWMLNEHISSLRWAGVGLIVLGAMLVTRSEQMRASPPASSPAPLVSPPR